VFPVRYGLGLYILFRINSVFNGLNPLRCGSGRVGKLYVEKTFINRGRGNYSPLINKI
jgi:hypothetical protein